LLISFFPRSVTKCMRVIAVTPAVPHPFGDTAAKWSFVLIRELLKRGHEVVSLTAGGDPPARVREAEQLLRQTGADGRLKFIYRPLQPSCSFLGRKIHSFRQPFSELLRDHEFMAELRRALAGGYDVLHLEQLFTGWVGLDVPRALLNIHHFEIIDWEDRRLETLGERKNLLQMTRATKQIVQQTRNMRMFSHRLLEKARTINSTARYWVLPFALDMSLYPLAPKFEAPVLGLIGSMHWLPSRSAGERLLTRIWPLVKRRVPSAKLFVAGWNAAMHLSKYLPLPDVEIAENLPHPSDFFSRVAVLAYAPSRGSGMKIKILESMAYGVPVVTTWEGVEGLDYENGVHCWVKEDDNALAEKISVLLKDCHARKRMREAARSLLDQRYSAVPVVNQMMEVYSSIAGDR
jgi:glycosyltransferase involved in cell wall biosynthesis